MKFLGIDIQEWSALIGIIGAVIVLFRKLVISPLIKTIRDTVKDYIDPLTKAINENTNSLNINKSEHYQFNKRIGNAEGRIENHEERIGNLERNDKK